MRDTDYFSFEGVGVSALDHVAVQTAYSMLWTAIKLFENFGFSIHPERTVSGDWGKAVFMVKEGSLPIQLTDSSSDHPIPPSENHIGILVNDPKTVAREIQNWAARGGYFAEIEEVPDGKFFITLHEILTIPIELVPNIKHIKS